MNKSFQKLKLFSALLLLASVGLVFAPSAPQTTVSAHHCFGHVTDDNTPVDIAECIDAGACLDDTGASCANADTTTGKVNGIVKTAINLFSLVVGVASVIMIIVGGLKYIMSAGDSNSINGAKNTILYAIIGLVIVAFAQIIVKFVLAKAR